MKKLKIVKKMVMEVKKGYQYQVDHFSNHQFLSICLIYKQSFLRTKNNNHQTQNPINNNKK
jgi:hypothetical protein